MEESIDECKTIKEVERELTEKFERLKGTVANVATILSGIDFTRIYARLESETKYPVASIIRLYLFRLVKGIKNYEKLRAYLLNHEKEAFLLGFFKDSDNKLEIPLKRTFNHYLSRLSPGQKNELNLIAKSILSIASDKGIVLDLEIVKKAVKDKISVPKFTETDLRNITKAAKKILYPNFNLNIRNTGKFRPQDIFDVLTYICFSHSFANDGSFVFKENYPEKEVPNGDTVLYHLKKFKSINEMLRAFGRISDQLFNCVRRDYRIMNKRKLDIAFDIHDLDYYGKNANYLCGGKLEHGTTKFFKFLTCSIVCPGFRFIIDVVPIPPLFPIHKLLDESISRIKNKIRINMAYLDRGFNSIEIIRVLKKHKLKFIMPVQRWETVKAYFDKDQSNVMDAMIFPDFRIGNKNNNENVSLVIVKDKPGEGGEKHPFIINFDIAPCLAYRLYEWYGHRWGIETCYRLLDKDLRPRTTSNNYNIRLFYFLYSCNLYNLWVLINIQASMILYGRNRGKPLISVKRFLAIVYRIQTDYFDNGG